MNLQRQQQSGEHSVSAADERLANGLGWFSIGLGLAEVFAPGAVAELIGVRDTGKTRSLLRFYGVRELGAGVGILTQPKPAMWLWSRVGGDMLDLATLASYMGSDRNDKTKLGVATAAVLGVTALDVLCAQRMSNGASSGEQSSMITKSIIVDRSQEEVYRFWRNFEQFPQFMSYLESVRVLDDRRSHWVARVPGGPGIEWDAEMTEDRPNELIAWRSLPGADVENAGEVRFERAPGDRGTLIRVTMDFTPPGGGIKAKIAGLFGSTGADAQIWGDLRRFKQVMEVGEVVESDASIHTGMHPAQPPVNA